MRPKHRARYELARTAQGLTVAEYERAHGLPPYSVYPEAANAKHPERDTGYFMYRTPVHFVSEPRSHTKEAKQRDIERKRAARRAAHV